MISYPKTVTVTKTVGHGPMPQGWTREQHEAEFFRRMAADVLADQRITTGDVSDVENKTLEQLLSAAPAPPAPPEGHTA